MNKFRQVLLILLLIFIWIYIGWRTIFTLPTGVALIPGIILLASEIILTIQNTLFYILILKPNSRKTPSLPTEPFTVDLYVTTYNESINIVKRTIMACKNLDYPQDFLSIWICDDGRRIEMKKLADSLGVGYITRDTNEHAKAGNLNNALKQTKGQLVVTIDADMIPKPNFLKNTLGYFVDEQVAFVQIPQSFYNDDIYQHNLIQRKNIPNEQDLFMRLIQAGRDRFNSTIYIGSNTIFRRKALESVNGFATGTITEDMATGMLIQSKGYKTVFHNEVLAQGLAAESLSDFISQRIRWARGTIQTMRKWNPITLPGLTPMQRLLYISSLIYWYFGIFKLIFILAPIVYLVFGIPALKASLAGIIIFWLPSFLLSALVENLLLDNRMKRFWSNIYETSVAPFLAWAVMLETLTKSRLPFKVTPKGVTSEKTKLNLWFAMPHLILLGLSLAALITGVLKFWGGEREGIIINLFWTIYNLIIIVPTTLLSIERPKFRKTERFEREFQVDLITGENKVAASTIDISETGCSLYVTKFIEIPDQLAMVIHGVYSELRIDGSLVYYDSYKGGYKIGINFIQMDDAKLQMLIKEIYGAIPKESFFQYKSKTGSINVLTNYIRDIRVPMRKNVRKSPRLPINLSCRLNIISEYEMDAFQEVAAGTELKGRVGSFDGMICDIGLNGCKIVINSLQVKLGDIISVQVSDAKNLIIMGKVVRADLFNDRLEIGVKWINMESSHQLLEFTGIKPSTVLG